MKDFTGILLLCIFLSPIIAVIATIISHRKIHNQSQKERRKGLIIILCTLIFVLLLLSAIGGLISDDWKDFVRFLRETFLTRGVISLMILSVVFFLYGYFRKDKVKPK